MPKKKTAKSTTSSKKTTAQKKKPTKKTTNKKRGTSTRTKKTTKKTAKKTTAKKGTIKKAAGKKITTKSTSKPNKATTRKRKQSKASKTVAKMVDTMVSLEKLDLDLFQDLDAEESLEAQSTTVVESPQKNISPAESSRDEAAAPLQSVKSTGEVMISHTRKSHSPHILDLTARDQSPKKPEPSYLRFLEDHDHDSWQLIVTLWQVRDSQSRLNMLTSTKLVLMHRLLNLSVVSWLFYIGYYTYKIGEPMVLLLARVARFIGRGFVEYVQMLARLGRVVVAWFAGNARIDRNSFLYPEKALVRVELFEPEPKVKAQPSFSYNWPVFQSVGLFVVLAFLVVLPIKGITVFDTLSAEKERVLGTSEVAYSSLQEAFTDIQDFSWIEASEHFSESRTHFSGLYQEFQSSHKIMRTVLEFIPSVRKKIITAESLVQVGVDVAELGTRLSDLVYALQNSDETATMTQKIATVRGTIAELQKTRTNIQDALKQVSIEVLPEDMQQDVQLLKETLPKLFTSVEHIDQILEFAYILMGGDKQQRYVLMFQNNNELRPSGGFMGSLSTVTVYQGKVLETKTPGDGPYLWQGWLTKKTASPKPLQLVSGNWHFQDANWFANFPTTAEKVLWFYHQIEPNVIDGVIAINADMLPEILKLTGDIELPEYDKVLTPDNVLFELQSAVELEYDREENQPKAIIADLFPIITERLLELDPDQLIELLEVVNTGLLERNIQMYFTDKELQAKAADWKWSGEVLNAKGDFIEIVDANIGGGKTNEFVYRDATLTSQVYEDGSIVNELVMKRTNDGIPGDPFFGYNYVNYFQVYVPEGAELLSAYGDFEPPREEFYEPADEDALPDPHLDAVVTNRKVDASGIEISNQFGKTVFAGWTQTNIGETSEIVLRYKVPVTVAKVSTQSADNFVSKFDSLLQNFGLKTETDNKMWHTFYWQKQSGQQNTNINYILQYPPAWNLEYAAKPGYANDSVIEYQSPLHTDFATGLLFGVE